MTTKSVESYRGTDGPKSTRSAEDIAKSDTASRELLACSTPEFEPSDTPMDRARKWLGLSKHVNEVVDVLSDDGKVLDRLLGEMQSMKKEG